MAPARQKQVDDAIARAFAGRPPSGKVRAAIISHGPDGGRALRLMHYQHELLLWRLPTPGGEPAAVLRSWHEKPTDKRILNAALEALAAEGA